VRIVPITTAEYPTPAKRPHWSVLDAARFERTFGFAPPDWHVSLAECLASAP
jgi:dTDP-4-dehydrorhamnose reductase